jgi:hypothetical protein
VVIKGWGKSVRLRAGKMMRIGSLQAVSILESGTSEAASVLKGSPHDTGRALRGCALLRAGRTVEKGGGERVIAAPQGGRVRNYVCSARGRGRSDGMVLS